MGLSQTICLGWPGIAILPISVSQIAGITGMNHRDQLFSALWLFHLPQPWGQEFFFPFF
jgi:hypothetical protein